MTALRITDLVFRWPRQARNCLEIPQLELAAGERVFLHGPSGSGKSSLLGLLGGVAMPEQGRDRTARHRHHAARRPCPRPLPRRPHRLPVPAVQPAALALGAGQRAAALHLFVAAAQDRAGPSPRTEAERLLGHLDLKPHTWHGPAGELSVGQQQRVAAARALIGRPEILIADEPTSALDAERQQVFIDLLLQESAAVGAALIFVSHDQRLAGHFDRSIALDDINRAAMPERKA
jgi:putative ABC transport system ATP-binding protein